MMITNENTIQINLSINNQYDYLTLLNSIFGLSKRELRILSYICELQSDIENKSLPTTVFSTEMRKLIMKDLKISPQELSNLIRKIKIRKMLKKTEYGGIMIKNDYIYKVSTKHLVINIG